MEDQPKKQGKLRRIQRWFSAKVEAVLGKKAVEDLEKQKQEAVAHIELERQQTIQKIKEERKQKKEASLLEKRAQKQLVPGTKEFQRYERYWLKCIHFLRRVHKSKPKNAANVARKKEFWKNEERRVRDMLKF